MFVLVFMKKNNNQIVIKSKQNNIREIRRFLKIFDSWGAKGYKPYHIEKYN